MKKLIINNEATIKANGTLSNGKCKPVVCIETGEVFTSMIDAAEAYGVNPANISNAVRGVQRTCKGKHFCYLSQSLEHLDAIVTRLRETSELEEDARKWREYQAEQEAIRKAEEERIRAEQEAIRKAEEEKRKAEEAKRKAREKRKHDIERLEAKLRRQNEMNSRIATEYVRSLNLIQETKKKIETLKKEDEMDEV